MSAPDVTRAVTTATIEALSTDPVVRFHCEPREPILAELSQVMEWIYAREHRGEHVTETLEDIVRRLEPRALCRSNDHLPLDENEPLS